MFKTILVATDFSEASTKALECAREMAAKLGASLHLLHVVVDPATQLWATELYGQPLAELIPQWQEEARSSLLRELTAEERTRVVVAVPTGSPHAEIIRYAKAHNVDLIVMGTHGRGGFAHLLIGSVAERVIRTAPCAVLTVRQPAGER